MVFITLILTRFITLSEVDDVIEFSKNGWEFYPEFPYKKYGIRICRKMKANGRAGMTEAELIDYIQGINLLSPYRVGKAFMDDGWGNIIEVNFDCDTKKYVIKKSN